MNKKSRNDPFFTKTFRIDDSHLAILDSLDSGEGRSATLRRLLEQIESGKLVFRDKGRAKKNDATRTF